MMLRKCTIPAVVRSRAYVFRDGYIFSRVLTEYILIFIGLVNSSMADHTLRDIILPHFTVNKLYIKTFCQNVYIILYRLFFNIDVSKYYNIDNTKQEALIYGCKAIEFTFRSKMSHLMLNVKGCLLFS